MVDRFSQCKKWREGLDRGLRAPMVVTGGQHFYLYEPAQLYNMQTVVPCFFYSDGSVMKAKCLRLTVSQATRSKHLVLKIPQEPLFQSPTFMTIPISDFLACFVTMRVGEGVQVANHCASALWRESRLPLRLCWYNWLTHLGKQSPPKRRSFHVWTSLTRGGSKQRVW